jgi:urease accessory protein
LFGFACGCLGLSLELSSRLYLRGVLRDLLSSAVRLNQLGPLEASSLQARFAPLIEALLVQGGDALIDGGEGGEGEGGVGEGFYRGRGPVQTAPIVDFIQSRHDLIYSRLFNS